MSKKSLIGLLAVVVLIAGGIYWFYASFNGILIAKLSLTLRARDYVAETYPGEALMVDFANYNFKDKTYRCRVSSPTSEDTRFDVFRSGEGLDDNYDYYVTGGENTVERLSRLLDRGVEEVFLPVFSRRTRLSICDFYYGGDFDKSAFTLDMPLDAAKPPQPVELTLWVESSRETPEFDELYEVFREVAALCRKLSLDVAYFTIALDYPYDDSDGERKPVEYSSEVRAEDVPRELIEGGGLEDFIEAQIANKKDEK